MKVLIENTADTLQIDKKNWTKVKFGAVAIQQKISVDRDKTDLTFYVKGEHMGSQDLHLREWGELTDEYLGPAFIRYFEKGDILYGSRRTYLRKVVIAPFEGITSNTTLVIKANEKIIDKRFLPFVMMSEGFTDHSIKNSKGSVNPYINWKDLANYEFLLPPKTEQARLAELLWAMDDVIENEKCVLENLENLKLSFVKFEIFEKSVNERIDFVKLGDIFDIKTGNKNAEDSVKDGIYPFFTRSIDTQRIDTYNYDQEALILPGEGNFQIKYYVGKFDVHQRTYILSKKIDSVINLKLYRDIVQAKVGELVQKSVGSTVDSLRKPIIENIKVPFLPINTQKNLLQHSSIQDSNISNIKMKLSASQSLQKSLINQIF